MYAQLFPLKTTEGEGSFKRVLCVEGHISDSIVCVKPKIFKQVPVIVAFCVVLSIH